jgi:hypothetical protein
MFGVLLGTLQKFKENSSKEAARVSSEIKNQFSKLLRGNFFLCPVFATKSVPDLKSFTLAGIPKVAGSITIVVRQTFQPARCGYTCNQSNTRNIYSPEYITSNSKHTQKNAYTHVK